MEKGLMEILKGEHVELSEFSRVFGLSPVSENLYRSFESLVESNFYVEVESNPESKNLLSRHFLQLIEREKRTLSQHLDEGGFWIGNIFPLAKEWIIRICADDLAILDSEDKRHSYINVMRIYLAQAINRAESFPPPVNKFADNYSMANFEFVMDWIGQGIQQKKDDWLIAGVWFRNASNRADRFQIFSILKSLYQEELPSDRDIGRRSSGWETPVELIILIQAQRAGLGELSPQMKKAIFGSGGG